jgi:hypothetical protein
MKIAVLPDQLQIVLRGKPADRPSNPEWTAGNNGAALCGQGEVLLGTGFAMPQPGNREVAWIEALPFLAPTGEGVSGRYTSNSGGTSEGQVVALCLK